MKESVYVSAVVYLNRMKGFTEYIEKLDNALNMYFTNAEIIIVNNGEGEFDSILQSKTEHLSSEIIVVNMPWKQDVEKAMFAGIDAAVGDFIFEIETPVFHYNDNIFHDMYKKAVAGGFDIYSANSAKGGIFSRLFYNIIRKISYLNIDLQTEEIRLVSRRVLNRVRDSSQKVKYRKMLYALSGLKYGTMNFEPLFKVKRHDPRGFLGRLDMGINILILFSYIGTQISALFSFIFIIIFILFTAYTLYYYFVFGNVAEGWTTLVILLSFGFSGIFFILGILGKYLSLLLIEKQQKPYIVNNVRKIEKK